MKSTTRIIACDVMREELTQVLATTQASFEFVSMGLHRWPDKLREELNRLLTEPTDATRIVLAFGLCGGAVAGLTASVPLFIPRAHDCIPLLLGSRYTHEELTAREKGTFFLSGGWLEGERTVFTEYRRVRDKYGEQKAKRVMATMFDAYRRLVFIQTGHPREEEHLGTGRELSGLLELEFQVVGGRDAWLRRIVNGPWDGDSFVEIAPGAVVQETDFGVSTSTTQN